MDGALKNLNIDITSYFKCLAFLGSPFSNWLYLVVLWIFLMSIILTGKFCQELFCLLRSNTFLLY